MKVCILGAGTMGAGIAQVFPDVACQALATGAESSVGIASRKVAGSRNLILTDLVPDTVLTRPRPQRLTRQHAVDIPVLNRRTPSGAIRPWPRASTPSSARSRARRPRRPGPLASCWTRSAPTEIPSDPPAGRDGSPSLPLPMRR